MCSRDELFLCSLECYLGNKHQNNPVVSTETNLHSSTCIILHASDNRISLAILEMVSD